MAKKRPTKRAVQKAAKEALKDLGKPTKKEEVTIRKMKHQFETGDDVLFRRNGKCDWSLFVGTEIRELPPFLNRLAENAYEEGQADVQNGLCKLIGAQRADGRA